MDRISFDIYIPDGKKFHWTPNWVVLLFGFLPTCICAYFQDDINQNSALSTVVKVYLCSICFLAICCLIVSFFLYEPLNGTLKGKIIFEDDSMTINDKKYLLRNINDLDFLFIDFYGKRSSSGRDLNPKLYQGVSNYITFTDNLNQTQLVYFKFFGEHSFMALSPFINEAIKQNKMSAQRGVDLLGNEKLLLY